MGFTEAALHKSPYPLIGFRGKRIEALGKIDLNVTSAKEQHKEPKQ